MPTALAVSTMQIVAFRRSRGLLQAATRPCHRAIALAPAQLLCSSDLPFRSLLRRFLPCIPIPLRADSVPLGSDSQSCAEDS